MNREFALQPYLNGQLLTLRPLRADDFDELFAVASDPLIWEQHPSFDRYKEDVFRQFFAEAMDSGGALVALDRKDGSVIGSSRYCFRDADEGEVEIGWSFLARSYWGGVYNREMKEMMLRHAFRYVDTVAFFIGPENWRSRKAVEKIGAVFAESRDVRGRESVVYRMTRAQFAEVFGKC